MTNTIPPAVFLPAVYRDDEAGYDPDLDDMRMGLIGIHDGRDCPVGDQTCRSQW